MRREEPDVVASLADTFERDGFAVVPNLLTPPEVERLRHEANMAVDRVGHARGNGRVVPNAVVEAPELGWLVAHPAVIDAARSVLRSHDIVFTMEADVHRNLINGKWHKDTGERVMQHGYFDCDPIGNPECRVVKIAFYLQDHVDGRGLRIRRGSHNSRALDEGSEVRVATRAGDAVLFDVRSTHRGVSATPTDYVVAGCALGYPRARRGDAIDAVRRRWLRLRARPDRLAVYFAFGVPGERTLTFTRRNLARQVHQTGAAHHSLDAAVSHALRAAGVELVDL